MISTINCFRKCIFFTDFSEEVFHSSILNLAKQILLESSRLANVCQKKIFPTAVWNAPILTDSVIREALSGDETKTDSTAKLIKFGIYKGAVQFVPRAVVNTALIFMLTQYLLPISQDSMKSCQEYAQITFKKEDVSVSSEFLKLIRAIASALGEEAVFRGVIQNHLQSTCFAKHRIMIAQTLFALNHLLYSSSLIQGDSPCNFYHPYIVQVVSNLLWADYSIDYEKYGWETALSEHLTHNSLASGIVFARSLLLLTLMAPLKK